jgi:hypothetical protein
MAMKISRRDTMQLSATALAGLSFGQLRAGAAAAELATELRQTHPLLPIAIITANIQDEIIARARHQRSVRPQAYHQRWP